MTNTTRLDQGKPGRRSGVINAVDPGTRSLQTQLWPMPSWTAVHNVYRIDLTGESMRKQRSPRASETAQA